jgi:hypothetical protein
MFEKAYVFDQDLSGWDVSRCTTFLLMFKDANAFRGVGLNTWNVGEVTTLYRFAWGADEFSANISAWNVAKVTNMEVRPANLPCWHPPPQLSWPRA